MPEHEIECRDCGQPYLALRRDAKTCAQCRQIRKLKYVAGLFVKPRKCSFCDAMYRAVDQGDRKLCSRCRTDRPSQLVPCAFHTLEGKNWVAGEGPKVSRGVPYCLDCISDPAKYPFILKTLRNKQRERKAKYLNQESAA